MKTHKAMAWMTLGMAVLGCSLAGCAHETASKPSAKAQESGLTPTFESRTPPPTSAQMPTSPSAPIQPEPSGVSPRMGHHPMDAAGHYATEAPAAQPQAPLGETKPYPAATGATSLDYGQVCTDLQKDAALKVEDVPSGVSILLTPRAGSTLTAVREAAEKTHRTLTTPQSMLVGTQGHCSLFDIAREEQADCKMTENSSGVRLNLTTTDKSRLKSLRERIRGFANSGK